MRCLTLILLLGIFLTSTVQSALGQQKEIFNKDQLIGVVLNLRKEIINNEEPTSINGTGSFVLHKDIQYIVTAAHVAQYMDEESFIIIKGHDDLPITINLIDLISSNIPNWQFHPKADIAILKLNPKREILEKNYLNGRFLPSFYFYDTLKAVSRETQLTIIGFPLGMGSHGYFSPLTYRTYPSSGLITLTRFDTPTSCEFIILENPSIGGYSGGPVFDLSIIQQGMMTLTGDGTTCHGFIHGTISDLTGGKLTAITPSYFLFDLLK